MSPLVIEFHRAVNSHANLAPEAPALRPDPALIRNRMRLLREEFRESMDELAALTRTAAQDPDQHVVLLRKLLKELVDLSYVAEGTAVALGLPFDDAYAEVHRSNMSKFWPDGAHVNEYGKVLKGPDYSPADMEQFVPDITDIEEA